MIRVLPIILFLIVWCSPLAAQDMAKLDRATQNKLKAIVAAVSDAMKTEDEAEVRRLFSEVIELLGDQAGLPEAPDEYRVVPENVLALTPEELPRAFDPYLPYVEQMRWWRIGLDPTKTNHALREPASVIEGCLAAQTVGDRNSGKLLDIAREAGDFLIWTQEQAGTGVLPFPAVRNGTGRHFQVAEAFLRRAERNRALDQVINNGWVVEDFDDGGLQFDNGLAGVSLVRLYEVTNDERYKRAAIKAAEWAAGRQVVSNWNYNSFSVFLLSEVFRITGEGKFIAAAKKKAMLGVLPGQLISGPRRGRWADPHNARPPYHYIMIRGVAALAAALPAEDPDLPKITNCLRMALAARNPDFQKGVFNADSSIEALVLVKSLPPHVTVGLTECNTDEALAVLERYAADRFRKGNPALSPAAWGQLLAYKNR